MKMGESLRKLKAKLVSINGAQVHQSVTEVAAARDIKRDYQLTNHNIGKGGFGSVQICTHRKSGKKFACKTITKSTPEENKAVFLEKDTLKEISEIKKPHPGLVKYKDFYESAESFNIVMELCSGEQLPAGRITEREAAHVMKNLMSILRDLHAMGIVHCDIKHANILTSKSKKSMKLVDFGVAIKICESKKLTPYVGTLMYMAPEAMSRTYSEKVDIWSAGVILYNLLSGKMPFKGDLKATAKAIKEKNLDLNDYFWEKISPEGRDLVAKMLCRDVDSRLSAEQVLKHPWVTTHTQNRCLRLLSKLH